MFFVHMFKYRDFFNILENVYSMLTRGLVASFATFLVAHLRQSLLMLYTRVCSKAQFVFGPLTRYTKEVVFSVRCLSIRIFKIHAKPASIFCQTVNLIQPKPNSPFKFPKPRL